MENCFVCELDLKLVDKLKKDLEEQGFSFSQPAYTLFQAKKTHLSCTLYKTGKFVVQGSLKNDFIEFYLEPNILNSFTYKNESTVLSNNDEYVSKIGSDESGKGDFFGPLCVASVFVDKTQIALLRKIGVQDSKNITDVSIKKIAKQIREICKYKSTRLMPINYNSVYPRYNNLNTLLAHSHAYNISNLFSETNCSNIIVDQFAKPEELLKAIKKYNPLLVPHQQCKAESDVAVAAASIIARDVFISSIRELSEQWSIEFPKGAGSNVLKIGKLFLSRHEKENLPLVAKMHFKTSGEILN